MADAPSFKRLAGALERIELLLEEISKIPIDDSLRAEARGSKEELAYVIGVLRDYYSERPYGHLLGEGSTGSFASGEIEKKQRRSRSGSADPVFIIGHWRSGTTLLSWLLDSHPRLAVVPENQLLMSLCGAAAVPQEPYRAPLVPMVWAYQSVQHLGEPRLEYFERYGELVDRVFAEYAQRRGKQRWVAKELLLHRSLDLLDLLFGCRCRFIFIHRHGLDVALSASERFGARDGAPQIGESSFDLETYLSYWVAQNGAYMNFRERNPERCHRVRYEEFVAAPEAEGKKIFAFLGELWPETILEDMQRDEHPEGLGDNKIFETGGKVDPARRERWKSLPPELVRQLGRMANPMLVRLGYPPVPEG